MRPRDRALKALNHEEIYPVPVDLFENGITILGDLVDAGLDILEVVQVTAHGMDASELKRGFGQHLAFYGGVDVQHLMPYGKPERIRDEVRRLVETLGKHGGYVCTTCHFLMDDVSASSVVVMYEEATNYHPLGD